MTPGPGTPPASAITPSDLHLLAEGRHCRSFDKLEALYKYRVVSRPKGYESERADPYGFEAEIRPRTASKVVDLDEYVRDDAGWRAGALASPVSIYHVHLGSWRRAPEDDNRWLNYRELAPADDMYDEYARDPVARTESRHQAAARAAVEGDSGSDGDDLRHL